MSKSPKFLPEIRERAIRLVLEHRGEYPSLWPPVKPRAKASEDPPPKTDTSSLARSCPLKHTLKASSVDATNY